MLLANRAETAALVLPGSPIAAWGKFRLVEQGEGGCWDCRDGTLEASDTFVGQAPGCLQSQVRFRKHDRRIRLDVYWEVRPGFACQICYDTL